MQKLAIKGFSFGLTSAVITTLGIIVGLDATTGSRIAIIGGILAIAIADAFSDALGIHIAEESEAKNDPRQLWVGAFVAFITKFFIALTFIIPIILFTKNLALIVSLIWGLALLSIFSYYLAQKQKIQPWKVIAEHVIIGIIVIAITHFVGQWIGKTFI